MPNADTRAEARRVIEQAIRQLQKLLSDLDVGQQCRAEQAPMSQNPVPPTLPGMPVFLTK